jgi:hypothetical protein
MIKRKILLGVQNAKTSKGESLGYLTGILYLAPADMVEGVNLCLFASKGCKKACLFSAGRGKFSNVKQARIKKTIYFRDNRASFLIDLVWSIEKVIRQAARKGLMPCIRLNGTSDIVWEEITVKNGKNIFELFPNVQFYDYTPNHTREKAFSGHWKNYHLTYSQKESMNSKVNAQKLLEKGYNVAKVYTNVSKAVTALNAIDGDLHDLRFLDKRGVIVALKAKGEAKKDQSGFVIRN